MHAVIIWSIYSGVFPHVVRSTLMTFECERYPLLPASCLSVGSWTFCVVGQPVEFSLSVSVSFEFHNPYLQSRTEYWSTRSRGAQDHTKKAVRNHRALCWKWLSSAALESRRGRMAEYLDAAAGPSLAGWITRKVRQAIFRR